MAELDLWVGDQVRDREGRVGTVTHVFSQYPFRGDVVVDFGDGAPEIVGANDAELNIVEVEY